MYIVDISKERFYHILPLDWTVYPDIRLNFREYPNEPVQRIEVKMYVPLHIDNNLYMIPCGLNHCIAPSEKSYRDLFSMHQSIVFEQILKLVRKIQDGYSLQGYTETTVINVGAHNVFKLI